jgi:hypothetical protein
LFAAPVRRPSCDRERITAQDDEGNQPRDGPAASRSFVQSGAVAADKALLGVKVGQDVEAERVDLRFRSRLIS